MHAETHSVKSQATEICWHILVQLPNIQFHEFCLAVHNFLHVAHGWTNMAKLIQAFSQAFIANAPNIKNTEVPALFLLNLSTTQ
jgi:hypothetical protein